MSEGTSSRYNRTQQQTQRHSRYNSNHGPPTYTHSSRRGNYRGNINNNRGRGNYHQRQPQRYHHDDNNNTNNTGYYPPTQNSFYPPPHHHQNKRYDSTYQPYPPQPPHGTYPQEQHDNSHFYPHSNYQPQVQQMFQPPASYFDDKKGNGTQNFNNTNSNFNNDIVSTSSNKYHQPQSSEPPIQRGIQSPSLSNPHQKFHHPEDHLNLDVEKFKVDPDISPFYYLTEISEFVDQSEDPKEYERIQRVFKENESLDSKLQEQQLLLFKTNLEFGLLTSQSERDKLNVELTQEKLDSLLMT